MRNKFFVSLLLVILVIKGRSQDQSNYQGNILLYQQNNSGAAASTQTTQGRSEQKPCADCEEVKKAVKAARQANKGTSATYHGHSLSRRIKKSRERLKFRMRQAFAKRKISKSSHSLCFNWS